MAEQVVFEQTIEGLFVRGLNGRLTAQAKERLRAAGLDLDRKLLPAYPFDTWMAVLRIAAEECFPRAPLDEALFKVGEALIEGYRETFLGRAVLGMVRVLGPRRTVLRATQNFRSGNNYTEAKVTDVSESCMELWMNEVGPYPTFTSGIICAALRATGVEPKVALEGHDGHACTYRITWAAAAVKAG